MPAISEAVINANMGAEHPWDLPDVYAAEFGPYAIDVTFRARAYTQHTGGSDGSTAWMKLYYNGAQVGEASDQHFNTANLEADYDFYLTANSTAELRIDTGNRGATVATHGFQFTWR